MSRKAQLGIPMFALFVILCAGFILYLFNDSINDVRLTAISDTPDSQPLEKLVYYSLMPLIWGSYLMLSLFIFIGSLRADA